VLGPDHWHHARGQRELVAWGPLHRVLLRRGGCALVSRLFIFIGVGLVGWAVFVRLPNFRRARRRRIWQTKSTLDITTRAPSQSNRTLVWRQILHPAFVLFFFFVLYGFASFFKDLANWLFK
jgi:hypothetical protein